MTASTPQASLAPLLPGGEPIESLLRRAQFFTPGTPTPDHREVHRRGGRGAEEFYRQRWRHGKVVRSTHGVNCTGSCSWKIYVKEGIIAWETQAVDYPSVGPDSPEYEPRGCPRGASFSWYTYSPARVRYPYIREPLLAMWREARHRLGDPVAAWAEITGDPERAARYKSARGQGGFLRASWAEVSELIAAAHVHTISEYGPDRVVGFSPIPAMSQVSYAAGTRFLSMIGGTILSFYDWYADMPIASPQVYGDQTDVPESGDWWNAAYLIIWGTNLPITRTPDAHFMTEARYRGQKVVVVSPDYSDHTKFADDWLACAPGTDGALAMAMGHVVLSEFFRDRQVPYFQSYVKTYTDLPFLVTLRQREDAYVPDRFLTAADLGRDVEHAAHRTVLLDSATGEPVVPNGTVADHFSESGKGSWNLDLGEVDPVLTLYGRDGTESARIDLPRFDIGATEGGSAIRRGVPVLRIGEHLVTTVFDLLMAHYAVRRDGLPGQWPTGYDDAAQPNTPAWQEAITSVPAAAAARVAREFARSAELSHGRSMIAMGAGTNHWFHSDQIYRTFFTLTMLCGCQGVNGGGWAHYVGQEKVRPLTGWQQVAFALDWQRPTRQMTGTSFFYLHTDQWRYEQFGADELSSPLGPGLFRGRAMADALAQATRLGWTPSHPMFDRNPLSLAASAAQEGKSVADYVVDEVTAGRLRFAGEDPDNPVNFPRVLTVWRANLLGSSGKGMEYFMKHLLGAQNAVRAEETPEALRPSEVRWRDTAPTAKLDLAVTLDFRMTSTCTYSDIVLPAATWYEKYDISTTDMHPFVHSFNPAIAPPWEARTDFDTFATIARAFSRLASEHLGTRTDVIAAPLMHDSADELAQPGGVVADWTRGESDPIPGVTMPRLITVERDYTAVAAKMAALGPLVETVGTGVKGISWKPTTAVDWLGRQNGIVHGGPGDGRPSLGRDIHMAEAILALSGTTNGEVAMQGWQALEERTGMLLADLAAERSGEQITFDDTQTQPRSVITSPEWSGSETGGRRYSPFVVNVERKKPWHTLTGRMHFFLDHDWIAEYGEWLPVYRPPLNYLRHFGEQGMRAQGRREITVRYLTPHSKWSIHSEYQDNLHMLRLFRGGPVIWMSPQDAAKIDVADNDWIEAFNRNGVVACRAVVTHRMPEGTVFMYHAMDRHLMTPKTEVSDYHGGGDNSLTRLVIKPTHMIGGYAQQSFGFNYHGPTGNQRDEITVIRRRAQEVQYQ
ncbi:nitrate reductase subunit alpha [Mycolicibacter terrae]|uniref:Nitrate reductase subunit alpha n=1 Tax=Mycolicibacter terrae TaxID=1788 RepID=A0ACD2ESX4_9MYCO|nr:MULTISPECIES: nitrate reductase subunit alpha [Mycolicibacter]OBH20232.1 nitrate reductase subunit alpha [Mycolicibacter sinensis]RRR48218.1 nitrate reductase subunit alpha [Mycolicibacter terrae]